MTEGGWCRRGNFRRGYYSGRSEVFSDYAGGSGAAAGNRAGGREGSRTSRSASSYMDSGHSGGRGVVDIDTWAEHRDFIGRGAYMDLVSHAKVGSVRGEEVSLKSLVFWTLLSLSAVVINSWGQTPMPTAGAPVSPMAPSDRKSVV